MKRILSLLLVAILCFSLVPMSLAAEEEALEFVPTETEQKALNMMYAFGLMDEKTHTPDVVITRGEFAGILAKALDMQDNAVATTQIFDDVPMSDDAAANIELIYKLEIMKGKSDTMFGPVDQITFQEAVTSLIRALGYEQLVSYTGGWFLGYYQKAKDINLLSGLTSHEERALNHAELAVLLKNFLNSDLFAVVAVNANGGVTRQATKDKTVLSEYHQVLVVDDIMVENRYTGLYSDEGFEKDHLKVGEEVLVSSQLDLTDYLGYRVEVYYDKVTKEVFYCEPSVKNDVQVVTDDKAPYISNFTFYYTVNNKEYKETLKSDTVYVYNQKAVTTFDESIFYIDTGDFTLIDNDSDGDIDVVKVRSYESSMIEEANEKRNVMKLDTRDQVIYFDDYENISIRDTSGKTLTISQLRASTVASILDNPKAGFIEIIISTKSTFDKIMGVEENEDGTFITFESSGTYPVTNKFFDIYPYVVKSGDYGTFLLDAFGKIAGYQKLAIDSFTYAYIIGENYNGSLSAEELKLKVLLASGGVEILTVASTVVIDGKRYKNDPASARDALIFKETALSDDGTSVLPVDTAPTINHLVRIKTDSSRKITDIDTTQRGANETSYEVFEPFKYDLMKSGLRWFESSEQFGSLVYMAGSARLFLIPDDLEKASDDDFSVVTPTDGLSDTTYQDITVYKCDPENVVGEVAVRRIPISQANSHISYHQYARPVVISKITESVKEDGEITHKVSYFTGGSSEKIAYAKDITVMADRGVGDVLMLHTNEKEEIDDYKLFYDYAKNQVRDNQVSREPKLDPETGDPVLDSSGIPVTVPGPGFGYNYSLLGGNNPGHRVVLGEVKAVYPDVYVLCNNGKKDTAEAVYEYHRYPTTYLIEKRNGVIKVSAGSKNDLVGYEKSPQQYSKVLAFSTYHYDYDLFIYNEY